MLKSGISYIFLISIGAIILLCHCSPEANRGLLTFFFDGVPAADTVNQAIPEIEEAIQDSTSIIAAAGQQGSIEKFIHYPYQEKECAVCHDENSLGSMVQPEPDLCYQCHEDFNNTYNYLHGPVAGGYCTACHNPHDSDKEKLLRFTGQELCFYCHEPSSVLKNEMHQDIGDWSCTECHNPHGGDDKFILY